MWGRFTLSWFRTGTKTFRPVNERVLAAFEPETHVYTFDAADGHQVLRISHIPFRGDQTYPPGVLMVTDDITDLVEERERRESSMSLLTQLLMIIVNQKDPYSTLHSAATNRLALGIADVLEVSEEEKRVIDLGSNMVNLGKAFVPQEVLTKTTPFTDDDRRLIHEGWAKSAKLLERVSFDLEVDLILQQTRENWDGSGLPKGLAGEEISLPARIISVANTFVGMLSDRAYRPGKDIPEATQEMVALARKTFRPPGGHGAQSLS